MRARSSLAFWALLFFSLSQGCVATASSRDCANDLTQEQMDLLKRTSEKIKVLVEPEYPKSMDAAFLAKRSHGDGHLGCVVLSFGLTEGGKAKNVSLVLESPKDIFTRESISALKASTFEESASSDEDLWLIMFEYAVTDD